MNLTELVAELRDNILNDRSDSIGGDPDQLWTDTTLVRYINEAQRRFAKRSFCIRDNSTPDVVNVTLAEGVNEYVLHPSILHVISARLSDRDTDLVRIGHVVLGSFTNPNTIAYTPALEEVPDNMPQAYMTDETLGEDDDGTIAAVSMKVWPTPREEDAGTIIKLRVVRMPLDDLTTANMSAIPEIPRDHHMEMLDWAAHLALRIVDHDAGNVKRSAEFAASFESHVQEAKKLILRKLFVPGSWGFGRGGFSWGC